MSPAEELGAETSEREGSRVAVILFYCRNTKELRAEFKKSPQVFLDVCREKGIEPRRNYSGKFNLRIPAELHEKLAIVAQAEGKSINTLAQEALQQRVAA